MFGLSNSALNARRTSSRCSGINVGDNVAAGVGVGVTVGGGSDATVASGSPPAHAQATKRVHMAPRYANLCTARIVGGTEATIIEQKSHDTARPIT